MQGVFSHLKPHFKKFNIVNQDDLAEIKQLEEAKKTYVIQEPLNQGQPIKPLATKQISGLIPNKNENQNSLFDDKEQNQKQQSQKGIENNNLEQKKNNQQHPFPRSQSEQKPDIKNESKQNDKKYQQDEGKQQEERKQQGERNQQNQNIPNQNYQSYNNNNNNGQQFGSKYPPPQKEEPIEFVSSQGPSFIKIIQFQQYVMFLDATTLYLHKPQMCKNSEAESECLIQLYKLQENKLFYDVQANGDLICLFVQEQNTKKPTENSYGLIFVKLKLQSNNEYGLQFQFLSQLESSQIKCFYSCDELEMFFLATENGNIHSFNYNLERVLFYEDPQSNQITSLFHDPLQDIILYSTNKGQLNQLDFINGNVSTILQINGKINHLQFVFNKSHIIILHTENNDNYASLYKYPQTQLVYKFKTISANYIYFLDSKIAQQTSASQREYFGLLAGNQVAVYEIKQQQTNNNTIYSKQLDSSPSCFFFTIELLVMNLMKIYYSNPSQVKKDKYALDHFRICIEYTNKQ